MQPEEAGVTSHTRTTGLDAKTVRPPYVPTQAEIDAQRRVLNESFASLRLTAEKLKAAHDALLEACHEAREFIDGQIDVVDGDDGVPAPNKAMKLATILDEAIKKAVKRA